MYMLIEQQNANGMVCSDYSFFSIELINLPFFIEQILITQGNIYLLQFSKKKNDKGLPGLTKLLPLSMKSL